MSKASPMIGNFNSGELSPMLDGRVDFNKYASGASELENFIPTVQGPIVRRGGTRFVHEVKNSAQRVFLYTFEFSVDQAYVIEFGNLYARFYTWDAVTKVRGILESSPGVPVEVVTPYTTADLFNADGTPKLGLAQSGDILYIAHPLYQQRMLSRTSAIAFSLDLYEAKGGPWQILNDTATTVYASAETGAVTLTASAAIFSASDVGSLFYLESRDTNAIAAWEVSKSVTAGMRRRSDSKTYEALNSGTTGTNRPVHSSGALYDGDPGVQWQYRDPGYGYVKITGYTSPTVVSALVIDRLPSQVVGTGGAASKTITAAVSNFLGNVRLTVTAHAITTATAASVSISYNTIDGEGNPIVAVYSGTVTVTPLDANTLDTPIPWTTINSNFVSGTVSAVSTAGVATTRWAFSEWSSARGWPTDVAFFRERLWWGLKQQVWGSVAADFTDFSPRNIGEVTADMAISITLVSGKINDIQWMIGDEELLCGTAGGEFSIGELTNGDPIGPGNIRTNLISAYGSRAIQPIKNGDATMFIQRSGLKARDVSYDTLNYKYKGSDATVLAEHITQSGVINMSFALEPDPIVWAIRADGKLIGFTWNNEQEVRGWHRHPIGGDGIVESLAVMPAAEGDRNELWLVVRRTIDGVTKRYVEYMDRPWRLGESQSRSFYMDSGLTYDGAPTATLSGLSHLEGMTVDVLADGAPHPQVVVTAGAITLQRPASIVNVGLPCPCKYKSMRIEAGAADGTSQGKTKRIHKSVLRFLNTGGGKFGGSEQKLDAIQFRTASDPMSQAVPLFSGDKVVTWPQGYDGDGYLMYVNDQPLPATLVAYMPQVVTQDAR